MDEFIDTYSDDLGLIRDAITAFRTHPLRAYNLELLDASLCRILLVFAIGSFEVMLEEWKNYDELDALKNYLQDGANRDRVTGLCTAFQHAGIDVDENVFHDLLAIKYLRNTIVHSNWSENQKKWIEQRGFPSDTRKLNQKHICKILGVVETLFLYIFITRYPTTFRNKNLTKTGDSSSSPLFDDGILRMRDLNIIMWNNLERISSKLHSDIECATSGPEYDWTEGRENKEVEQLNRFQQRQLWLRAAKRAGEEGYEPIVRHRDLAREALAFWKEYVQRTIAPDLDQIKVTNALEVLGGKNFDPSAHPWPIFQKLSELSDDSEALVLIGKLLGKGRAISPRQVADSLKAGQLAHNVVPNITPVSLFGTYSPIVDPQSKAEYNREWKLARQLFILGRTWYSGIEYGEKFDHRSLSEQNPIYEEVSK